MSKRHLLYAYLFFILFEAGCTCSNRDANFGFHDPRTLSSLKKIDEAPLYLMHYYESYDVFDGMTYRGRLEPGLFEKQIRWACSCFSVLGADVDTLLGRNFDWYEHAALLLFTHPKDAYASVSLVDIHYLGYDRNEDVIENPKNLISAPLIPFDGLNEHGLSVGMMAVPSAQAPHDPQKKTAGSLRIIRLMLDQAKNVDEAVTLIKNYNIDFSQGPPLHYMLTDATKKSVIVEFVNNQVNVLPNGPDFQVSTNFILTGLSHEQALDACMRYRTAWRHLESNQGSINESQAMALLRDVAQDSTLWSIVYNLSQAKLKIVMDRKFDQVHQYNLK